MRLLPKPEPIPALLVGNETSDDAGVYQLTNELAIIQSLDYFTPIVDDPYMFGQIAAANAMSDVYAMGGKPITAMNIVGYPIKKLGSEILAQILTGAADKVHEAGAVTVGGHSIDDQEPKFGLSVTGTVHPDKIWRNVGAQPGDLLVLTKPIGVGIITTGIKRGKVTLELEDLVTKTMATLNKVAGETAHEFSPNAVTDITGFGLVGHSYEMATGSNVTIEIDSTSVPMLPNTKELAEQGVVPGGSKSNYQWILNDVEYDASVDETTRIILSDAITSGGLLLSLPANEAKAYVDKLHTKGIQEAAIIGKVIEKAAKPIYVK